LAMGNTVVLKPAEFTSLTALAFAEIVQEIDMPPGVINIVTGDGRTGEALVNHPAVDKIAFTGSTEVGRIIRRATAGTGKRVSLELGGKSPFLVFDDADLDSAVEGVVDAIWFNQGQVCCAGSRLLVQESIAETLIDKIKRRMETLRVGDPLDKAIDIGAIVAPVQLERIQTLVKQGVDEGAAMWQPTRACPTEGYFYPPTLFTGVAPAATIAQVEIFGPVLVSMTFRSPAEAVALANNTPYGLAASVWSENINLALDVARRVKAGTVWINSTNLFDAASGFGGYRESGFGREGGKEGLYEYVRRRGVIRARTAIHAAALEQDTMPPATRDIALPPTAGADAEAIAPPPRGLDDVPTDEELVDSLVEYPLSGYNFTARLHDPVTHIPPIDRTPKLYIGGKQVRPDSGYSILVPGPDGQSVGEVGEGNRKDIRNAVEAAHAAFAWSSTTGYNRSQILYYLAENLSARIDEFARRIVSMSGRPLDDDAKAARHLAGQCSARTEVELAIERLFTYGAWADKYDGRVAQTPLRGMTLAVPEPLGVIGILCPNAFPLLGFVSLLAPAIAMANTVVIVPSEAYPLSATDYYQVLETSDVPAGVVNVVTGKRDALAAILAAHDDVQAVWYFGPADGAGAVEAASAGNLKRTWTVSGSEIDWTHPQDGAGEEFLREATQVKNIWTPHGD
ncbi:MAG: aldehyde dehydrogenase, partial [Chloroflexi bacterium]|nr:aldehyde dehydrogenase [Chloroflexota bacterium]